MLSNFDEPVRKILLNAQIEMKELKHPYIGSEHLLLAILKNKNEVSNRLLDYNLNYNNFKKELIDIVGVGSKESEWTLYTPLLKRVLENAIIDSKENNNGEVTISHLFSSILEEGEGVAIRIMLGMGVDLDELYSNFSYKINNTPKNKKLLLEEIGIDLTKKALNGELDPVIGREKEIKRVLEILSRRNKNNPILIGEAGVGKTAIVEGISRLIAFGNVPLQLKNKRIISLDMASSVAGTKYRGEFEERIKKILKEVEENDEIILFIDEIHTLIGAGGAEGAIDASNIFKPSLARNKLRCIGATTLEEYKQTIEKDKALERRFQKVIIEEPDGKATKEILTKVKPIYESYHNVKISNEILDFIINNSSKYIHDRKDPDRTIDVLDEVCALVSLKESSYLKKYNELHDKMIKISSKKNNAIMQNKFKEAAILKEQENELMDAINKLEIKLHQKKPYKKATKNDVLNVISLKSNIPLKILSKSNEEIIGSLKNKLTKAIYGQKEAIDKIINVLRMEKNNCKSMMFCGPSGVGKTSVAKIISKHLVGSKIIRLDMTEYKESHSVSKIIGSPPGYVGYEDNYNAIDSIRTNPYSVIILDEIEKAHNDVINLFLQILDEGKIKDSKGREINFSNCLIIMTTNIENNTIGFNQKESIISSLKDKFHTSFINRIDEIITFNNLDEESLNKIIKAKSKLPKATIDKIIEESNYKEFGARQIDKLIKKYQKESEKILI